MKTLHYVNMKGTQTFSKFTQLYDNWTTDFANCAC
jgi:hypothetical protein